MKQPKTDKPKTDKSADKIAKAKSKAKAKQPRVQMSLEGIPQPKTIQEVDVAAEAYREVRDARIELSSDEKTAKSVLADVMKKHDLKAYKYKDGDGVPFTVLLDDEVTVKVKKDKAPKGED